MGLCIFNLAISLVMIEMIYIYLYIYTLSYYHHQIGSLNYYLLFRVRSWSNVMRCVSLYILLDVLYQYLKTLRMHMIGIWVFFNALEIGRHFSSIHIQTPGKFESDRSIYPFMRCVVMGSCLYWTAPGIMCLASTDSALWSHVRRTLRSYKPQEL